MERQDLQANINQNQRKKSYSTNDKSHDNKNGCNTGHSNGRARGGRNGRSGEDCSNGKGRGVRGNSSNGGGKLKSPDTCPLLNHSVHTWGECFQNVANTNNCRNNNGGGSSGGEGNNNCNNNNNHGNGGDAHVNKNDDNNNNNDNSSRFSDSSRSSRRSNNNNNKNPNDIHLVIVDGTDISLDMYHVNDNISEAYYNTSINRFNVDLSDNFEHYAIAEPMRCQEVIVPIASMPYGHDL